MSTIKMSLTINQTEDDDRNTIFDALKAQDYHLVIYDFLALCRTKTKHNPDETEAESWDAVRTELWKLIEEYNLAGRF